jgi:hypothetical protein
MNRRKRIAAGTGLSLGAALSMTATAHATDFTVTNALDTGDGSLRDAVDDSQLAAGPDRILFQSGLTGTVTLSSTLGISQPLEILGPGAGAFTVSGANADRVINIDTAVVGADVKISGLSLIDGHSTSDGGVISTVDADLTIEDAVISGGTAELGAGVYSNLGTTTILDSTIQGHVATEEGGGIYSLDAELEVIGSTVSGNGGPVGGFGGGIDTKNASTLIQGSTVSGNNAGNGGGVRTLNSDVGIQNSTISGNTATGTGGGSGYGYGGGLWLDAGATGSMVVYGSTFAGNDAEAGGGISANASATNGLANTVVADNTAPGSPDLRSAGPDPYKLAFTLVESTDGASVVDIGSFAGSNILGVDPQLGPLAANGGATPTHKPALTSPLVDKGFAVGGFTDQRGSPRPFDSPSIANSTASMADGSDIGSVELQASDFATATPTPPGPAPAKKACKKGKKKKKKKCKKRKRKKKG